jgi:hypothetical protein
MIERREDASLPFEPRHAVGIGGEDFRQDFHGDVTIQFRIVGAIDLSHPALAELFQDLIVRDRLADSLFMKGMHDDLLASMREGWSQDPELSEALEQGYAEGGFAGANKRFADALAARYGKPGGLMAYPLANYYARAGDAERIIEWLEKAYEEHNNNLPYMRTPVFDAVRDDPRFQDLVRRVGLPMAERN